MIGPLSLGKDSPYLPFLPSPLLGLPECDIEEFIYYRMVESGNYDWVSRQWWLSNHDRPDIVARSDRKGGPLFTVIEVKAGPLRERHFRQVERYVARLGQLVGQRNVVGMISAPDLPLSAPLWGRGRTFYAPPEWIAIHAVWDAEDAA